MPRRPSASAAATARGASSPRKPAKPPAPPGPQWKPAQRAVLAGSRRPHPLDLPPPPRTRDEGWARLLEIARALDEQRRPVTLQNAGAEALYEPIRASYARPDPPVTLDPQVERLRAALLPTPPDASGVDAASQALAAFWVGTAGLGFVFDVCNAPEPWNCLSSGLTRILVGPPDARDTRGRGWGNAGGAHFLKELRRLLFALPEPDFLKARDEAFAWLERVPAGGDDRERRNERVAIAYALARDPTLAHELAREVMDANTSVSELGQLLASIADLGLARELVDRYALMLDVQGALVALDVVETFGRDAAELMQKILDGSTQRSRPLKPFFKGRLQAAIKLALTDPRPPTP